LAPRGSRMSVQLLHRSLFLAQNTVMFVVDLLKSIDNLWRTPNPAQLISPFVDSPVR
ncbi:hypothetical protein PROFUN_04154, partial [Planoprotostelium fungivorum]